MIDWDAWAKYWAEAREHAKGEEKRKQAEASAQAQAAAIEAELRRAKELLDESERKRSAPPVKSHDDRPRFDLIPLDALEEVAWVFAHGATTHEPHGWTRGCAWSLYLRPALGHIVSWALRRGPDPDSKRSHLAHAVSCLLILLAFELRGLGADDRNPE